MGRNGWLHVGGTVLDGAEMFPVIGMVAVSDEAYVLLKNVDNLFSLKRISAGEILQKIE